MRGLWLLVAVVGLALAAGDARADIAAGDAAYNRGDYATALAEWTPLAEAGDAEAQFDVASMYQIGQGVPQDYAEAVRWFRLAADQGHAMAQISLALMYDDGLGVAQDYAEAVRWWRRAADQGVAVAQGNLALLYALGRGVPRDYNTAHMWANIAGANGNKDAPAVRDVIAATMSSAEISEAQRQAKECLASNYTRCDN